MTTPFFRNAGRAAVLLAILPLAATAQTTDPASDADEPLDLETIEITADPLGRGELESTRPTTVLTGDELDRAQAATLGETLADQPGVANSDFGPGAGRVVIRGQGGPRVRVLDNGVGTFDVSTISPDHNVSIEPFRAQQIEVLRGPATLLYGSGAIGGVVNVVDNTIPMTAIERADFGISKQLDSASDGRTLFGFAEAGFGAFNFYVDGAVRRSNDLELAGPAEAEHDEDEHEGEGEEEHEDEEYSEILENSFVETETGSFGTSWTFANGFVGASVKQLDFTYGIPGHEHGHEHGDEGEEEEEHEGEEHGEEEGGVFLDGKQTRYDLKAEFNDLVPGITRIKTDLAKSDYKHIEFEGPGEPGTVFTNDAVEGRLELTHAPIGGLRGVIGVQALDRDFEAVGDEAFVVVPVNTRQTGVFLVEELQLGAITLEAGGRIEQVDHEAGGAADRDYSPASYSLGASFAPTESIRFVLSGSVSERAPVAEELYSNGPHLATETFEVGNLALVEETANNIDLGVHLHGDRFFGHAAIFMTQYDDYIYQAFIDENGGAGADGEADRVSEEGDFEADGELLLVNHTQADAEFFGGELELGFTALRSPTLGEVNLRLFGDTVTGELSGGPDDGDNLPRITPQRIGVGVDWARGIFRAGLRLTEVDEQTDVAALEDPTDGYTLLAADFDWRVNTAGTLKLGLRGRNLLDEEVRRHTSFVKDIAPAAGRSVLLDARYTFR